MRYDNDTEKLVINAIVNENMWLGVGFGTTGM